MSARSTSPATFAPASRDMVLPAFDLLGHPLIALGIGLLIGAERERRKLTRAAPTAAGLRSFTLASLLGAVAIALGGLAMLAAAAACMTALAVISYWRTREDGDPGITTEIALITTVLLGGLSASRPGLAGSIAVIVTIVLAARMPLHRFVGEIITGEELSDLLIIAGATMVVLPLLPDRAMGPFLALNPHTIWLVVILVLGINAAGHFATRLLGMRLGVPLLGLCSGFISSSATIGAMGAWVRTSPASLLAGVAAAVLSTVATFVQLCLVVKMTDASSFAATAAPLAAAGAMALVAGSLFTIKAWRKSPEVPPQVSRSFSLMMALAFAAMLAAMLVAAAALRSWFGTSGLLAAAAIGGVLDVHAAAISVAAQVADGSLSAAQSVAPILVACTTSTIAKMFFALTAGPRLFGHRVALAQLAIITAAWLTAWIAGM